MTPRDAMNLSREATLAREKRERAEEASRREEEAAKLAKHRQALLDIEARMAEMYENVKKAAGREITWTSFHHPCKEVVEVVRSRALQEGYRCGPIKSELWYVPNSQDEAVHYFILDWSPEGQGII